MMMKFDCALYSYAGESVCLACYVANGHIMVYSLPSLKLLLDVEFLALTELRYAHISLAELRYLYPTLTELVNLTF